MQKTIVEIDLITNAKLEKLAKLKKISVEELCFSILADRSNRPHLALPQPSKSICVKKV